MAAPRSLVFNSHFESPAIMTLLENKKRIYVSIAALAIALLAATSALDFIIDKTPGPGLDKRARNYFDASFNRAIYTFAVVRGVNGIISVIQGTDIAISPAGVGVRMAVGEILDPVNDLVERFSWVVLVSTTSLGVQKLLLEIGAWFGIKLFLTAAMVVLLIGLWTPGAFGASLVSMGWRLALASLVIRFCIPAVGVASEEIYDLFLEKNMTESSQALERIKKEITDSDLLPADGKGDAGGGYLEKLQGLYDGAKDALTTKDKISELKERLAHYARYTINLIIAFILQTIVIPLLVFWALIRLLGFVAGRRGAGTLERKIKASLGA